MIRVVTDATPWIDYFSGKKCAPLELALEAGVVSVPPLVQTELLGNSLEVRDRKTLEGLLRPIMIDKLHPEHWQRAGLLKAQLEEKGIFLSARDAHVVQCCIDQEAVLLSSDPLFRAIQKTCGVTVQIW
ncbi:MAG: PIN domain-containing protein [Bdellovibrionota bacterium]